jgi:hypothetical protein
MKSIKPNTTAWTPQAHKQLMFEQREAHLGPLTAEVLRDLARNESAPHEWRRAAVEILLDRQASYVSHPDLAALVAEIRLAEECARQAARSEVESIVESIIAEPPPEEAAPAPVSAGPFAASVTTAALARNESG